MKFSSQDKLTLTADLYVEHDGYDDALNFQQAIIDRLKYLEGQYYRVLKPAETYFLYCSNIFPIIEIAV